MRQCYSCMQFVPGDRAQVCPHCGQPLEWSCELDFYAQVVCYKISL